jgi:hypothetical protein
MRSQLLGYEVEDKLHVEGRGVVNKLDRLPPF